MCDDLDAAIADLAARGIAMDRPVAERDWGRITTIALPGGTELALYQPMKATMRTAELRPIGRRPPRPLPGHAPDGPDRRRRR